MAIPRLSGLALSPDGNRLVTAVGALNPDKTKWQTALWEIDPAGDGEPRRLTRSAPGESGARFLPNGDLLFTSARPDPGAKQNGGGPDDDRKAALWLLPAAGGEARLILTRAAGVDGVAVAADAGDVAFVAGVHPGHDSDKSDRERHKARQDAGVTAILHEAYPVRHWDHDLGPTQPHVLFLGAVPDEDQPVEVRDLTPDADITAGDSATDIDVSADGRWLVRTVELGGPLPAERRTRLDLIDVTTGDTRVLASGDDVSFESPRFSPDGQHVVCRRGTDSSYDQAPQVEAWLIDVTAPAAAGAGRPLVAGWDRWPSELAWSPDGTAVFVAADDDGEAPIFRIDVATDGVTQLTARGSYSCLQVARDGSAMYALRSGWDHPPRPVRLDPVAARQDPVPLPSPGIIEQLPGTLDRIEATAADGARIPSWLLTPHGATADSPTPLVLWPHGGPIGSWNAWSWRWCPWLLVARGYAVLLPDPAFSTGYGHDFIQRGWGQWGGTPYSDLMAAVDSALARPELDETRTAVMGGSYGGYMANWIATQTDRFRAIVTHASIWHLDGFGGTTDGAFYWEREFGDPLVRPERYAAHSPHRFADAVTTPMLVIHGDRDYRVPIGEGLRLWYDLQKRGVESKFLYYPDENHWVLTPGNHTVWYETVLAFLDRHVLGKDWTRPPLL
ncbi:MAG: S9 family peptidase [Acidimicrobiales bacterium]